MKLKRGKEVVLAISDMQAPYHHPDAIRFLRELKKKWNPTRVVCIGDSMDQHQLGRFTPDPNAPSPSDEYEQGMVFMREIYKLFPKALEVESNHNTRYLKQAHNGRIPDQYLKSYREIMQYPKGWDIKPYVEIDDVIYEHGERSSGGAVNRSIALANGQSTVYGHHHSAAGVVCIANRKRMIWAMNVGCLIDHKSYGLAYAKTSRFMQTLGAGIVDKGVPYFEPL